MKTKIIISWVLFIGYAGLIFYLSSLPKPLFELPFKNADKILHFLEFSILALLFLGALVITFKNKNSLALAIFAIAIIIIFAILDEIHQKYVPGRDSSGYDVLADFIGATIGTLIFKIAKLKYIYLK